VDTSWTIEQRRDYVRARDWARQQYVPWAIAGAFGAWHATVGRLLFDDLEESYEDWRDRPEAQILFGDGDE